METTLEKVKENAKIIKDYLHCEEMVELIQKLIDSTSTEKLEISICVQSAASEDISNFMEYMRAKLSSSGHNHIEIPTVYCKEFLSLALTYFQTTLINLKQQVKEIT